MGRNQNHLEFNNNFIQIVNGYSNLKYNHYLWKELKDRNQFYKSLIIEEMAQLSNIDVPHTELVISDCIHGELIEDYRKDGFHYISGTEILYDFFQAEKDSDYLKQVIPHYLRKDYLDEMEKIQLLKYLNTLEIVWNALEFRYQKYLRKNEIVNHIMGDLSNRFAFDFLTMQRDRHASNWEVEENDEIARLTPHFDSNRSFYYPSFSLEFHVNSHFKVTDLYEELEYFLIYSDDSFCHYFYTIYELFTPEKILLILDKIEIKLNHQIPIDLRLSIIGSYEEHYGQLRTIVERRKKSK